MDFLAPIVGRFFSPWGLGLLAALDSSVVFFLPFGVDAVLVSLVARQPDRLWLSVLTAAMGSLVGGAITLYVGRALGSDGVKRFVDERRLQVFRERFSRRVVISTTLAALIPPPFPFTAVLLTCGAIRARPVSVLAGVAIARLARFAAEAWLARTFGASILVVMESTVFQWVVGGFIALAIAGTAWSAWKVWGTRSGAAQPARRTGLHGA
jgi:membrane protein YqaA with SNARE-associated domain